LPARPSDAQFRLRAIANQRQRRLVDDFELHTPPLTRATRAHNGAQRARDASLPADHLAEILLRNVEAEDERVFFVHLLDTDCVWLVDELAREELE
jgi:hypothetical protein